MSDILDQLDDWRRREGSLSARLSAALQSAIGRGAIPVGSTLPPERHLASLLGVSRGTIVAAMRSLAAAGLIERRQGSGSRVVAGAGGSAAAAAGVDPLRLAAFATTDLGIIDMTNAAGLGAGILGPELWDAVQQDLESVVLGSGYLPFRGLPSLRSVIADHMSGWGLAVDPEQVAICTGAQQAISVCATALITPGDRVIVERQSWPGALDAFREAGARLVPISSDPQGPDIGELRDALGAARTALVYLTPSAKNPTGTTMPAIRRARVVEACSSAAVPVIDDAVCQDVTIEPAPSALAAFDNSGQVITIGSASKLFWGGLRVGWMHTAEPLLSRLVECKRVADLGTSLVAQVIVTHLVRDHAVAMRERRVRELSERRHLVRELVDRHLPGFRYQDPSGGFALWLELPVGDGREFTEYARREGVAILPGSLVSADGSGAGFVRLAIVHDAVTTRVAFQRLGAAWSAYRPVARPLTPVPEAGVI
jgi:DNA-binding transcriptional MocR family regulator